MRAEAGRTTSAAVPAGRCRCGHFPTQHMIIRPIGASSNFRLEPTGPCTVCGEAACRAYVPAGGATPRP